MGWAPWEHGTHNGYANHGCRCYWCKEANTLYLQEWRDRVGIPDHVHGTYNGYVNYGCRGLRCKQAYSETKSAAYLRRKAKSAPTPP